MAARNLTLTLATLLVLSACGGARAALQVQPFPGDREATGRRLESLARTYENTFGCTETDTIVITGMSVGVYGVSGCNTQRDYMLSCRPGGGYGPRMICEWQMMPDLAQQAAADMNCAADAIDFQNGGPGQRVANGCGFRAMYMLQCGGSCMWMLAGRIEQVGPTGGGVYVTQ
jgi:hypothetical protein